MAIITVTNTNDSGAGSLREAIAQAQSGDTIAFASNLANQTITLTSGVIRMEKSLIIDGTGADNLTISGNNNSKIFFAVDGNDLTLKNLTFINGRSNGKGGAVQAGVQSDLTVINSIFKNNVGGQGGAIHSGFQSNLVVENSIFDNNDGTLTNSGFSAGAIANDNDGSMVIRNSTFTNNKGVSGGAVYNLLSGLIVENSVFLNNTALDGGGAIFTDGASSLSSTIGGTIRISDSRFEGNQGRSLGGALYLFTYELDNTIVENTIIKNNSVLLKGGIAQGGGIRANGDVLIRNVSLIDNFSEQQGGGLWLDDYLVDKNVVINVENTTFSGNRAGQTGAAQTFGGAIAINPGAKAALNVTNSTIINNYAGENGGAFWVIDQQIQPVKLTNSIVAYNTANNGLGNGQQVAFELIDGGGNIEFPAYQGKRVTANSLIADPKLGTLQEINSILVYPLLEGSPAINTGVLGGTTTDALGTQRDSQPDIGAYEFNSTPNNAEVIINQSGGVTFVEEGRATDTYSVILSSQPTANVTIAINSGNQLTTNPTQLVFTPQNWNIAQNVTVTAVDDSLAEGNHNANIQHTATSTDTRYNGIAINSINTTITDNDNAGVTIRQSGGITFVEEGGETDTYTVVLNSQPTADVIVNINGDNQITTSSNQLVFTPQNWNIAQNVTVTAIDDNLVEGEHNATIQHTTTSTDSRYNGISISSVNPDITDNDNALAISESNDVFTIKGSNEKTRLQVNLTGSKATNVNELGFFVVDDAQGRIDGIAPNEAGYAQAALNRSQVIFSSIANIPNGFNTNLSRLLELNIGDNFRFYLVKNSSLDDVQARVTPISNVLFSESINQQITDLGSESFLLSWKDGTGSNVNEFQDLVVTIQPTNQPLPLGVSLQGQSQAEVIDLRNVNQNVKAEFTIYREAEFNNFVSFYKVVDENGGIDTNGDGNVDILPGEAGYTQAAIRGRLPGIELTTNNQSTATYTGILEPGSILAPFIIVNGTPEALLDNDINNNPIVYFPYLGANSDNADHIRLLGDNTFGFEDLQNDVSDQDFNDIIVQAKLTTI
ncbi:MAG TPA: DUF4114 domain-containing protein [Nostocaceae cyanobacterium]|nr:DUF4114 domain-containing protein [Nostocaceae cyanobacterium]